MADISDGPFPLLDIAALAWFVGSWLAYVVYSRRRNLHDRNGLLAAMNQVRQQWVKNLTQRDNRIVDSQVINGLIRKETFFASTTLLILASIVALLGAGDQVIQLFHEIPYAQHASLAQFELKVSVLAVVFVYAFFKFTWSIRQHSYCSILLAALPLPQQRLTSECEKTSEQLTRLSNLAARHFNDGMRAYYFALAELSWLYHPAAFFLATCWVLIVLYRREFHSRALSILR